MKTPEELAEEYANKHECGDQAGGGAYGGFLAGFNAGHSAGFEAAMKIHDAVREHLEKEMFPIIQHEPLLMKYTKDKDE